MSDEGVLLLDKPPGISSFQALRPVKRAYPKTKIGHAGTLDPAATGLLLVGVGGATRLLEYLEGMPKTYAFTALFGMVSDSYDLESPISLAQGNAENLALNLDGETVEKALSAFRGPIRQTPPDYSAIKIQGERACDRVRAGETVTLASREVIIHSLELRSFHKPSGGIATDIGADIKASDAEGSTAVSDDSPHSALYASHCSATFEMTCSKGTYVRSLVHDLGQVLGCGAVTDKIRRLAIGPFRVENARSLESLAAASPASLDPVSPLLPLDAAVSHLPLALLSPMGVTAFLHGRAINADMYSLSNLAPENRSEPGPDRECRALDATGRLIAIATLSPQGLLCPKKVLVRN